MNRLINLAERLNDVAFRDKVRLILVLPPMAVLMQPVTLFGAQSRL